MVQGPKEVEKLSNWSLGAGSQIRASQGTPVGVSPAAQTTAHLLCFHILLSAPVSSLGCGARSCPTLRQRAPSPSPWGAALCCSGPGCVGSLHTDMCSLCSPGACCRDLHPTPHVCSFSTGPRALAGQGLCLSAFPLNV